MKYKKCFCPNCKITSNIVGVNQIESHYYSIDLNTHQWKDFHGSDSVESQEYFCINCNNNLKDFELE